MFVLAGFYPFCFVFSPFILAAHHLSTYDYITLQQQQPIPTPAIDDDVSVADELQPCSAREFSEGATARNFTQRGSSTVKLNEEDSEKKNNDKDPSGFGCINQRSSRVGAQSIESDSISTVSARVATDSGRYTGVDTNAANAPLTYRGVSQLAPLPSTGVPTSSRSPRHRRRRTRKPSGNQSERNDLEGLTNDGDYHQQLAEMRASASGALQQGMPDEPYKVS